MTLLDAIQTVSVALLGLVCLFATITGFLALIIKTFLLFTEMLDDWKKIFPFLFFLAVTVLCFATAMWFCYNY